MSEKLEAVRGKGVRFNGGVLATTLPGGKTFERAFPVAIVPVPENGEVREMWEWQVNHLQTEIVTRARRDAILEEPSHTWSASDFRPVTVIDRPLEENHE